MAEAKDERKFWYGSDIADCQVCKEPITTTFVDGATPMGWAILCPACHKTHGHGLGTGKGQQYVKLDDGRWLKMEPAKPADRKEVNANPLVKLQAKLKTDNRSVEF